jgi:RimJ/RimL family protein N-acetyltransferase
MVDGVLSAAPGRIRLRPLDAAATDLVAAWLAADANAPWLDLGQRERHADARVLLAMARQGAHVVRVFTGGDGVTPAGLVALRDVAGEFGTATLWYVLGDKRYAGCGYTTRAVAGLLDEAFGSLGLGAINAWIVDGNEASRRVLVRNGFQLIGRQRRCHRVHGEWRDRLLFDLLAGEHGTASRGSA